MLSCKFCEISKGGLKRWNFSFTILKFLFRKKSVEIFQEAKCVSWNIIQFVHTIKFHSYDHDNVSFIERINNFHFSYHRYYSFKSCLKILKIFKDFPKIFSECAMFIRDRRSTNLTKNIVTAAPVSMKSTLDNAEVLDPLLRCNSVYYSTDNKKITSNYYPFPQLSSFLFIICLVILIFLYFLFIRMFLNFHSFLLSCSPHISHLRHFQ